MKRMGATVVAIAVGSLPVLAESEADLAEARAIGLVYQIQQSYRAGLATCDIDLFNVALAEKKSVAYMMNDKRLFDESLREGMRVFDMAVRGGPTQAECDELLGIAKQFGLAK